ncbi:hypothetical protein ACHAXT_007494 [Thalassiosira profunda]
MARKGQKKKTEILIPEPRHRVGPKGVVSSGISFRDLPEPSLDEIKKICEHYQQKTSGTYKSLASRYVYQMATEIDHLVDALKEGGYDLSEGSLSTLDDRESHPSSIDRRELRSKRPHVVTGRSGRRGGDKRNVASSTSGRHPHASRSQHASRPHTASAARKPAHVSYGRSAREFPMDYVDRISLDSPPPKAKQQYSPGRQRRSLDSLARLNLEDQNEEVLRWLKEEMRRSQSLISRSKQLHDAELVSAKKEVEKVKKAAKLLIKAMHKKGKDKVAKSEAHAESERRRRVKSQKLVEGLIESHAEQIDILKKGLRRSPQRHAEGWRARERFYPWGELEDDRTDVSFSVSDASASDLTSILDDLADEAFQRSHSSC